MTLVLDRGGLPDTPVTHAFVIGCGRFPARTALNRAATAAGARRIVQFLTERADRFEAPVWTIELLISDPAVAAGADTGGLDLAAIAPEEAVLAAGPHDAVEHVLLAHVREAGDRWLQRIRPGDQAFVYTSSHGISDGSDALALCEDVLSQRNRQWSQSINMSTLALGLTTPLVDAAKAWVFLDACQEIVPTLLGRPTGTPGFHLLEPDPLMVTKARNSVGVAGSRVGGKAWAPTGDEPPFFTQALIEGLENACVEAVPDIGWAVTASRLMQDLPRVAEAALGRKGVETSVITRFNQPLFSLLRVEAPMIPIALSTEVEAHMQNASIEVVCDDEGVEMLPFIPPPAADFVWRFRVQAHRKRTYTATATFGENGPAYRPADFDPDPPCQFVRLRRAG